MRPIRFLVDVVRNIANLADQNAKLHRENQMVHHDLERMQAQRDWWVKYQAQTASESGKAQEIMTSEINRLREELGRGPDERFAESIDKWKRKRINNEDLPLSMKPGS
jgi:hypothetical protein